MKIYETFKDYSILLDLVGNILDAPSVGGNISVKDENMILIKSSGEDLKNKKSDACLINLENNDVISGGYFLKEDFFEYNKLRKPSMEYSFHKNFKSKYVIHYHPIYVLPYLCSDYTFNVNIKVIPYKNPGKELADSLNDCHESHIIFLRNHGIIIHSDSIEEIKESYYKIKNDFFTKNSEVYTPDDFVDKNNYDLWLFRNYIEYTSLIKNLNLMQISKSAKEYLENDKNEKYRKKVMKK